MYATHANKCFMYSSSIPAPLLAKHCSKSTHFFINIVSTNKSVRNLDHRHLLARHKFNTGVGEGLQHYKLQTDVTYYSESHKLLKNIYRAQYQYGLTISWCEGATLSRLSQCCMETLSLLAK